MEFLTDPRAIEERSREIIRPWLAGRGWTELETAVAARMVHAAGDPALVDLIRFSPGAAEAGVQALAAGAAVVCDVEMLAAGIRPRARRLGVEVVCAIGEQAVAQAARARGETRAMAAMRGLQPRLEGTVVAVGNAPTALLEVLRMLDEGLARPALVVGTPVGFVGAAEAKQLLMEHNIPWVSIAGTRGGSALAAAAVNALLVEAARRREG